jgi:hypothetical protein
MLETREQLQTLLAHDRLVRGELDILLVQLRDDVVAYLKTLEARARYEAFAVNNTNEVALGAVADAYVQLGAKVEQYEAAQDRANRLDVAIEDAIRTLADDEVWR